MNLQDLQRQIADLRAELAVLVKSEEDLSRPEVIAKSKELKELIFLYYRLTSSGNEPEDPIHLQTV